MAGPVPREVPLQQDDAERPPWAAWGPDRWNSLCETGEDVDFGGPVHDVWWRIVGTAGDPIPGLYEAGELGGTFGYLYLAGGDLTECDIGGRTAARHASAQQPWPH